MSKKKFAVIAGIVFAGIVAIACSSGPDPVQVDPQGGGETSATADVSMFTYGQTVNVGGKFEVTVSAPVEYTPGEYAVGYTGGAATAFDVTIKNASDEPLNLFTPTISANTADGPAESIFDSGNGVEMPTGELFPGESTTFRVAFDGAVVRVKVEGFLDMSEPAYFVAA